MTDTFIVLNSKLIRAAQGLQDELTPGIIDRKGVFETAGVHDGKIFAWDEHVVRLKKGLKLLKIVMPQTEKYFLEASRKVIHKNKMNDCNLRISVWKDTKINFAVAARRRQKISAKEFQNGFKAAISPHIHPKRQFSSVKSLEYSLFRKAFIAAKEKKCDEAILINGSKNVVEGSRTNLFLVKNGRIITPPVSSGCLNGVARNYIIALCRELKNPCDVKNFKVEDLMNADEVFCTNSSLGLMPITAIDHQKIKQGKIGPISYQLNELLKAAIARNLT